MEKVPRMRVPLSLLQETNDPHASISAHLSLSVSYGALLMVLNRPQANSRPPPSAEMFLNGEGNTVMNEMHDVV